MSEFFRRTNRLAQLKRWRWLLWIVAALGTTGALLAIEDLRQRVVDRTLLEWTVIVVPFLLGLAASPYAWRGALESVTCKRISISEACWQTVLMVTGKYVPGQMVGAVARMASVDGVSFRKLTLATFLEQGLSILVPSALVLAAWAYYNRDQYSISWALGILFFVTVAIALYLALLLLKPEIRLLPFLGSVLALTVQWIMYGVAISCAVAQTGQVVTLEWLWLVSSAFAGAYVAGMMAILVPSGLGVREAAFAMAASHLGMAEEDALALAITSRLALVVAEMMWALLILILRSPQALISAVIGWRLSRKPLN